MIKGQVRNLGPGLEAELVVENAPDPFRAQQGGIQFDRGMKPAFLDEIAPDFFHFIRRASVHGGYRDIIRHAIGNIQGLDPRINAGQPFYLLGFFL